MNGFQVLISNSTCTTTFRCELAGGCEVATTQRFVMANGLAVTSVGRCRLAQVNRAWFQFLKLPDDELLSSFACSLNLGLYTSDRQTFFVVDPPESRIHMLRRSPSAPGQLKPVASFKTMHTLDNIEMSADDAALYGGSILLPYTHPTVCEAGAYTRPHLTSTSAEFGH